jgi:uncharacterized protein (DUF427 family)
MAVHIEDVTVGPAPLTVPSPAARFCLEPRATKSQCAYKGEASHWSLRVGEQVYPDVAWFYPEPLTLVKPVAGLVAFFQERVDAVYVDGEQIERPHTPWARSTSGQ